MLSRISAIKKVYSQDRAFFWRKALFWTFWLSLAFFPIGYGYREVVPPLAFIFLLLYLRQDWNGSTIRRLGRMNWLFLSAAAMTTLGVIFSLHPWQSFLHACMGLNKAYILPFIAMECVRDVRDLKRLCWACVFACFWQGLDGLWQAFTGADFIMGYTHSGRLTGSLGDYTVGNYLVLAMVPAFGVFYILRQNLSLWASAFVGLALFWPGFFLFLGASSRSGILALAAGLAIWGLLRCGLKNLVWLAIPAGAWGVFMLFQASRFAPRAVLDDNRWDLWRLAWEVICAHPWLGAGAGQYNSAFRELGLAPAREVITISHPHNLYLDLLYAHGITGFVLGMIFLCGFLAWGFRHIKAGLASGSLYWILAAWFWLGYAVWFVNGVFGHDFYRIWWLALAMSNMGVMIGAVINAPGPDREIVRKSAAADGRAAL